MAPGRVGPGEMVSRSKGRGQPDRGGVTAGHGRYSGSEKAPKWCLQLGAGGPWRPSFVPLTTYPASFIRT